MHSSWGQEFSSAPLGDFCPRTNPFGPKGNHFHRSKDGKPGALWPSCRKVWSADFGLWLKVPWVRAGSGLALCSAGGGAAQAHTRVRPPGTHMCAHTDTPTAALPPARKAKIPAPAQTLIQNNCWQLRPPPPSASHCPQPRRGVRRRREPSRKTPELGPKNLNFPFLREGQRKKKSLSRQRGKKPSKPNQTQTTLPACNPLGIKGCSREGTGAIGVWLPGLCPQPG